ncbi:MAG: LPXTG cell wall anchor domain-containing protein, partial [Oscillospiraceae bacterium]|nr:LPXTG cell wall anchor domain-containing protein [Oscillospiraceae bacterium]
AFGRNSAQDIKVELTLSKDTDIKYAGLLTKINWRFMATERTSGGGRDDGNLYLTKTVTGGGSKSKQFEFRLYLDGDRYTGDYYIDGVRFTAEKGVIWLKDGETASIRKIDYDTDYEVEEEDYTSVGYHTSWENRTGEIDSGATYVNCTNRYGKLPFTGDWSEDPTAYLILGGILAVVASACVVLLLRKKKKSALDDSK